MHHRYKSKTALICILLCLPTVFIVIFAVTGKFTRLSPDEIVSVEITTPYQNETFDSRDEVEYFVNMLTDGQELSEPLYDVTDVTPVIVKLDRTDKVFEYALYPVLSTKGCMYRTPDGTYKLVAEAYAEKLLVRSDFDFLYESRFLPTLYVKTGTLSSAVTPSEYSWSYALTDNSYVSYSKTATTDDIITYSVYSDRMNSLSFSVKPDDVTIEFKDKNGALVAGTDIATLIYARDTVISAEITAKWTRKSDTVSHGEAKYKFDILYDIPAIVTFSSTEVSAGGYITVNTRYFNEDETLSVSSSIDFNEPLFTSNEGVMTAVLAVPDDTPIGYYDIKYKVGDNETTVRINVTGPAQTDRTISRLSLSSGIVETDFSAAKIAELDELIAEINSLRGTTKYALPSEFDEITTGNIVRTYGTKIIVNLDGTADTKIYYCPGYEYEVVENARVMAAASGKVIYVGENDILGKFAVVDHGFGVCTWYCMLGNVSRSVGETISKGAIIGFAGTNKYTSKNEILFLASAGENFFKIK